MDIRIRRNEVCIIGLPRCDFVFSSTRSAFIAYGFENSPLEMTILRGLLEERGIQPIEAGGALAPAQSAFCAKICSKIITSQFCIVLLNNEVENSREIPNANVNMEYGLMLGFNKYILPFQRASQKLPFNVAGLDTIKYTDRDFPRLAAAAIDKAIADTTQDATQRVEPDQHLETFLISQKALITRVDDGDRALYDMGIPLGFYLLNDFSGLRYYYFGAFTHLRPENILSRLRTLAEILDGRVSTIETRIRIGLIDNAEQAELIEDILRNAEAWLVVNSDDDREALVSGLATAPVGRNVRVWSLGDVRRQLLPDAPA